MLANCVIPQRSGRVRFEDSTQTLRRVRLASSTTTSSEQVLRTAGYHVQRGMGGGLTSLLYYESRFLEAGLLALTAPTALKEIAILSSGPSKDIVTKQVALALLPQHPQMIKAVKIWLCLLPVPSFDEVIDEPFEPLRATPEVFVETMRHRSESEPPRK
jgi:hypothetical protein